MRIQFLEIAQIELDQAIGALELHQALAAEPEHVRAVAVARADLEDA